MQRFHYANGAAIALLGAGPIFMLPIALFTGPMALLAIPIAIPIGAAIAVIPVLLGGYLMGWIGAQHEATRKPFAWGATGALLAFVMASMFDATPDPLWTGCFIITGAACALLVRLGTRWDDETPPVPNDTQGEVK